MARNAWLLLKDAETSQHKNGLVKEKESSGGGDTVLGTWNARK